MKNTVKERNSQLQQLEEQTATINDGQVTFDSMTARAKTPARIVRGGFKRVHVHVRRKHLHTCTYAYVCIYITLVVSTNNRAKMQR